MNIILIILIIIFVACGYQVGELFSAYFGAIGKVVGSVVGFFLAVFSQQLIWYFWNKWFPVDPPCKNGKCLSDDYEIVGCNQDGTVYRCKCGTKYLKKLSYFKEILEDGTTKPYMVSQGFGGRWKRDL
jgi:hypothetical protein